MTVTDFFAGEIATELLKQLVMISARAWRYKNTARKLLTLIESIRPTIREIQYSGVELPAHRQLQISMLFETLEKGKKLTDKILTIQWWNVYRQLTLARELEKLERTIYNFFKAEVHTHILADVHLLLQADPSEHFERIDESLERLNDQVDSMIIRAAESIRDEMTRAEATTMETDTSKNFWFGFIRDVMNLSKIKSQLGMIIGCLLLLFFCLQYFAHTITPLLGKGGDAIDGIVVEVPKVLEYSPTERTEITVDKDSKTNPVRSSSSSDAKTNANLLDRTSTNSLMDSKVKPPQIQVFINFRGIQLRNNFVGYLVHALLKREVNVYIDNHEQRGEDLNTLFKRIEDSRIAIVVFSTRYTESTWCLEELVKIKERVELGLLKVLPIFYKVSPTDVKRLKGEFGDYFRDKEYIYESDEPKIRRWKEAILFVSHKFAFTFDDISRELEIDFVERIVKEVLVMLQSISIVESGQSSR